MHALASRVIRSALRAADPAVSIATNSFKWAASGDLHLLDRAVFNPAPSSSVFVLAGGKASIPMAAAALRLLQERPSPLPARGLVVTKTGHTADAKEEDVALLSASSGFSILEAAHPVPDESSVTAASAMLSLIRQTKPEDLVIVLLSGGGSSLLTLPCEGLSLVDLAATSQALLRAGCSIDEVNAVRKHCSAISGGKLALEACSTGATMVTLVLSDVVGDSLSVIASGPTVPDDSTFQQCLDIVERRYPVLLETLPQPVLKHLKAGAEGKVPETLKALPDEARGKHHWHLVGNNRLSLEAAARCLREDFSIPSLVLSSTCQGEAKEVAKMLVAIAQDSGAWEFGGHKLLPLLPQTTMTMTMKAGVASDKRMPKAALLVGGETTVNLGSGGVLTGKGGRNQEMALAAFLAWKSASSSSSSSSDLGVLCFSTDGSDGPTDATGAFIPSCAELTKALATMASPPDDASSFLSRHDAYSFFDALGKGKEEHKEEGAQGKSQQPVRVPSAEAGLIRTGGTGTNVCDLAVFFVF